MKVEFIGVGRGNDNWISECDKELNYEWLYQEVKKVLMSDEIDFSDEGDIIVGGFRKVGEFKIKE